MSHHADLLGDPLPSPQSEPTKPQQAAAKPKPPPVKRTPAIAWRAFQYERIDEPGSPGCVVGPGSFEEMMSNARPGSRWRATEVKAVNDRTPIGEPFEFSPPTA